MLCRLSVVMVVFLVACSGCHQDKADGHPDVLGFDAELRSEIRKLLGDVHAADEVEVKLDQYLKRLKQIAAGIQVEPDDAGNMALPAWATEIRDQIKDDNDLINLAEELGLDIQDWAHPLMARPASMNDTQRKLLTHVILAESLPFFHGRTQEQ